MSWPDIAPAKEHWAHAETSQRYNLRDYGGYETTDAERVVSGMLFRSAEPDRGGHECAAHFASLELGAIIDFRSRHEIPLQPEGQSALAEVRVAAEEEHGIVPHAIARFRGLSRASEARAAMCELYREMVTGPHFLQMTSRYLHALAATDRPTLVHCVAGKDRTGLAVALFHSLLGVKPDAIMREYLLTNAAGQPRIDRLLSALSDQAALQAVHPEVLSELLGVRAEYLETAFAYIEENSDGAADYLHRNAGIDEGLLMQLRRTYLGSANHAE